MTRTLITLLTMVLALTASAGTTREEMLADRAKSCGVYYAYPVTESLNTAPPKGYKPFYISHYSRHGSRYLISDRDYTSVLDVLRRAHAADKLTPKGEDVLARLERVWKEAEGRGGDLTPLGVRQHKGIAKRMYEAYPEVFEGNPSMSARSTTVMRCALSMDAFCESLKEQRPALDITREASNRYMNYLNYHAPESNAYTADDGPWREEFRKFRNERVRPARLMGELFNDSDYVYRHVNPEALMWGLYWISADQQNIETRADWDDVLTPEEMFDLWQTVNYDNYVRDSAYPGSGGLVVANAKPLLRNILESADEIIAAGGNGATLRFGHDGNLIPLAAILRLEGAYDDSVWNPAEAHKVFANYQIAPMAGNVQIVFFRDKKGDVIVKFMLNERETAIPVKTDMYPFYRWDDVKAYYEEILRAEPEGPKMGNP